MRTKLFMNKQKILEIKVDVTPELAAKLTRVGKILDKRYGRRCNLPEVMDATAEIFLRRLDPGRRPPRPIRAAASKEKTERLPKPPVPSTVKLDALRRDRSECRFPKEGRHCGNRKRVDVFPRRALPPGRKAELKDVVTLCAHHWKSVHFSSLS
jgi:hypothetical protein